MKREYFCYCTAPDGKVVFARDVHSDVQLFDADRALREAIQRGGLKAKIGHSSNERDVYICYWTRKDGVVDFARNVEKDVQLFSKDSAESGVSIHGCLIAKVGFIGIDKDGMPLSAK